MPWRRRPLAIDSQDLASLRAAKRRAGLLRLVLAAGAVAAVAAAASSARGLDVRAPGLLAKSSTGVVVLDLSLSIVDADYPRVGRIVRQLVDAEAPVGLVIFSDVAYELLPPGTPARELRPLLRMLTPPPPGEEPADPWADTFRSGTVISKALQLAAGMLERDRVDNGSILLVSDLETAPDDVPNLTRVLREIETHGIPVRVVPLSPTGESRALFETLLGREALSEPPPPIAAGERPAAALGGADLPGALLVLGAVLFLALAAHERFAGRLALPVGGNA
jgi:hypothetical protein